MKGDVAEKIETEPERLRRMYVKKAMDENHAKYFVRGGMYIVDGNIWVDVVYFFLAGWYFLSLKGNSHI